MKTQYVPVISYHQVGPDEWYWTTTDQFEEHMKFLHDNGYTALNTLEYENYLNGEGCPYDKPVIIVFDDARDGVYHHAFPILKKYNIHFIVEVISTRVVNSISPEANKQDFIAWEHMHEMVESGLCDIGLHTAHGHQFVFGGFNEDGSPATWGRYATPLWQDDGITVWDQSPIPNNLEFSTAIPVAGTSTYEGELFKIETMLGFRATKDYTIDRIVLHTPSHVPAETCYDVKIDVWMGEKTGPHTFKNEVKVKTAFEPLQEPVDLVDPAMGMTWVNGRYDIIYFDRPFQVKKGVEYNIYFKTLNMSDKRQEYRIYAAPTLPYHEKNCATTSISTDYDKHDKWVDLHYLPDLILSNGSGRTETDEEFKANILADLAENKLEIQQKGSSKYIKNSIYPVGRGSHTDEAPLWGASRRGELNYTYSPQTGLVEDPSKLSYQPNQAYYKIKFDKTFSSRKLEVQLKRWTGNYLNSLVDIYIGPWSLNPDLSKLTKVRNIYFINRNVKDPVVEIGFDDFYRFEKGETYCIAFISTNEDYWKDPDNGNILQPYNFNLMIDATFNPAEQKFKEVKNEYGMVLAHNYVGGSVPEITSITNVRRNGDGYYDWNSSHQWTYGNLYPELCFVEEIFPEEEDYYNPPVWQFAYPYGAHRWDIQDALSKAGVAYQFLVYSNFFSPDPLANVSVSNEKIGVPRLMMKNDKYMAPFSQVVKGHTMEMFQTEETIRQLKVFGYVIGRPWGCRTLRREIDNIDAVVFDCYNFDPDFKITGEPNKDKDWAYDQGKECYAMFGNWYGPNFSQEVVYNILHNPYESVKAIVDVIKQGKWHGVAIDFENVPGSLKELSGPWFKELRRQLNLEERYYEIFSAAPFPFSEPDGAADADFDAWYDYAEISKYIDYMSPMTYLDHASWTGPGPISDFEKLKLRYEHIINVHGVPPVKLVGGTCFYSSMWRDNGWTADLNIIETLSYIGPYHEIKWDHVHKEHYCRVEGQEAAIYRINSGKSLEARNNYFYEMGMSGVISWKFDDDDPSYWVKGRGTNQIETYGEIKEIGATS